MDETGNIPTTMNWDLKPDPSGWLSPMTPMSPMSPMTPMFPLSHGCICPPTSEQTCRGDHCPRQPAKEFRTA
jgi:hypothetical protein